MRRQCRCCYLRQAHTHPLSMVILTLPLPTLSLHPSPCHDRWPRPAYFVFFGAWHLRCLQQLILAPDSVLAPVPAPVHAPSPIPIAMRGLNADRNRKRCQNASMQSAALRSCCLFHPFSSLCNNNCSFSFSFSCSIFLLLSSCSCSSLTNCAAFGQDGRRTCCLPLPLGSAVAS